MNAKFFDNIHNFRNYEDFVEWMSELNNMSKEDVNVKLTPSVLIGGYCEDFGVYFAYKYNLPLWCFDDCHFLLIVNGRYYDGYNNFGINSLKKLEFIKQRHYYDDKTEDELKSMLKIDEKWKDWWEHVRCYHCIDKYRN